MSHRQTVGARLRRAIIAQQSSAPTRFLGGGSPEIQDGFIQRFFSGNVGDNNRKKGDCNIGIEVSGLLGLLILIADVWAVINVVQSGASTGAKVG